MISVDTNILLHACNTESALQSAAEDFLTEHSEDSEFALCELVLIELYVLLRNPIVIERPLGARKAADICLAFRRNPHWRIIDYPGNLMDKIWKYASHPERGRRTIFDARLAYTLRHHGVTEFATRDGTHFRDFGFRRVWDPLV